MRDSDLLAPGTSDHQQQVDETNLEPTCEALLTGKREMENYIHQDAIKAARNVEISFSEYDDVPLLAARAVHETSESDKAEYCMW